MNKSSVTALLLMSLLFIGKAVDLSSHSQTSFERSQVQLNADLEAEQAVLYPAVDNLYNVFTGNPLSASDPGFQTFEVYTLNWAGDLTSDGRFKVPKEFYVRDTLNCSAAVSSESVMGMSSYQKSLQTIAKLEANVNALFWSASFQGSVDYQNKKEGMEKQETVSTLRKTSCQTFRVNLNDNIERIVNPLLAEKFRKYHANNDWENFVKKYGAHYVTEATYGAMAVEETSITKSEAETLVSMGLDISVSVRGSSRLFEAGASSDTKITNEQKSALERVNKKSSSWVIGVAPDPAKPEDFNAWIDRVQNGKLVAQPIQYRLTGLERVFDTFYWPKGTLKKELDDMKAGFMAAALKIAASYPAVPQDITLAKTKPVGPVVQKTLENGWYIIKSKNSGLVVDIPESRTDNGMPWTQFNEHGGDNQIFYFEKLFADVYRIKGKGSGKYMDVKDMSANDGAVVQIFPWNGSDAQKFTIQFNSDDTVTFYNLFSGKVLDVPNSSKEPKQKLQMYVSNNTDAQRWYLKKVG